jgi:HEAT repeat protein
VIPQKGITLEAALRDLGSERWEARAMAAGALGSVDDADREAACAALRKALRDDRGEVRFAAAMSLAELKDAGAAAMLVDQLDDGDGRAREAAALALGRVGNPQIAWAPLASKLRIGPPAVRFQAAASLAEIDAERAAPLLRVALRDEDPEVRANAASGLAEAPHEPETIEALAKLLDGEKQPEPRFEAAYALAQHGDKRATLVLHEFLRDETRAYDAAGALSQLADPRSVEPLRRLLRRWFAPPLVKVRAAHALAQLGEQVGREYLEKAAQRRREDVSGLAKELLEKGPYR